MANSLDPSPTVHKSPVLASDQINQSTECRLNNAYGASGDHIINQLLYEYVVGKSTLDVVLMNLSA